MNAALKLMENRRIFTGSPCRNSHTGTRDTAELQAAWGRRMIGLKRGSVKLISHQDEWDINAENVILELKEVKNNASYLYSGKSGTDLAGCSHCMRGIRKLPNDGALSGIGRCISVLRLCDMEKREGRQRGEVRWEKRS